MYNKNLKNNRDYERNPKTLTRWGPQNKKNLKNTAGALQAIIKKQGGDKYFDSDKILIIAPSGSGKSLLAANLAITKVKKYNNLVIICPPHSKDDQNLNSLAEWCDETGMNVLFTSVDKDGNIDLPAKIEKALFIIDDYYDQQNMDKVITKMISSLNIGGRHAKNNIIYICHSDRNIPHVIRNACNALYINKPYPKRIELSEQIPLENDKHQFFYLDQYEHPSEIEPFHIEDLSEDQILKLLKTKIHSEDSRKKKLPGLDMPKKKIVKAEKEAGNTAAKNIKEDAPAPRERPLPHKQRTSQTLDQRLFGAFFG